MAELREVTTLQLEVSIGSRHNFSSEDHTLLLNDHNTLKNALPRALFIRDLHMHTQVFAETFSRGSKTLSFHHTTMHYIMNRMCHSVQIYRG